MIIFQWWDLLVKVFYQTLDEHVNFYEHKWREPKFEAEEGQSFFGSHILSAQTIDIESRGRNNILL